MNIYCIINKHTGREAAVAGGFTWTDAARRAGLEPEDWYLDSQEFID